MCTRKIELSKRGQLIVIFMNSANDDKYEIFIISTTTEVQVDNHELYGNAAYLFI